MYVEIQNKTHKESLRKLTVVEELGCQKRVSRK